MKLLVSVRDAIDAAAALEGGADIIDAKDPASGALGAVSLDVFGDIHARVAAERPVTAALGDAIDEPGLECAARAFAGAGARLVKIGFSGIASRARAAALITAACRGASGRAGVIATAYADADRVASLDLFAIVDAAASAGAAGVLLDTADKQGRGLRDLIPPAVLCTWVGAARDAGLLVALAGKLTAGDLGYVCDAGANVLGVRSAVCDHGRTGQVLAEKVRTLAGAMLGLTLLPTCEPVEQRNRPSNRSDRSKEDERVDHHRSPA